jgi:hypothetical protein
MPLPASGKWTRPNATLRPRELTIDSRQNPKVSVAALSPDGRLQNLPICEVWSKKASPSALQTPFSRRYSGSTASGCGDSFGVRRSGAARSSPMSLRSPM